MTTNTITRSITEDQAENMEGRGQEFRKFFIDELKDIYWAEKHLAMALPKMAKAATSEEVRMAFAKHTEETQQHINIVEQVFELLGEEPRAKKCAAMEGLITEAEKVISDTESDTFVRDAALILAGQKAEHYEIATYGTLRIFARYLNEQGLEDLLVKILDNEKYTDVSLTKIAEGFVNKRAAEE